VCQGTELISSIKSILSKGKKKQQEEWTQKMFEEREQTPLLLRKMILGAQPGVFLSEW